MARTTTAVYVGMSVVWIVASDALLEHVIGVRATAAAATAKALCFVAITGTLLYRLLIRQLEDLRELEAEAQRREELRRLGEVAAAIAHEFKNVLTGCRWVVDALEPRVADDPQAAEAIVQLRRGIESGQHVSSEILSFARPHPPVVEPIEVAPWLRGIGEASRSTRMPASVHLEVSCDSGLVIAGDRMQLERVLLNLVINASDAMPDGGTIRISCEQAGRRHRSLVHVPDLERYVHIAVSDSGVGMTEHVQQRIFEPLFTTKRNGTGLGLPIVNQVVTAHGGFIAVRSAVGEGTTFHLFLPSLARDQQ